MELQKDTIERYKRIFGEDPQILVTAPARVNIIGEHTDYNQGYVLPVAIDRKILIAAGTRSDNIINLHSIDFQTSVAVPTDNLQYNSQILWMNYVIGVASILRSRGYNVHGLNFCIRGNIPIGSGLSSSAALEVATAVAINYIHGFSLDPEALIQIAHKTETDFVGVLCGIMDQFIVMYGKKNHALFLDCRDLEHSYIRFPLSVKLVVCDTGIHRELANSSYNVRAKECKTAIELIRRSFPSVSSLRDVTVRHVEALEHDLPPLLLKRVRHVQSENERVLKCVEAMMSDDLRLLGSLMIESHISLRDDYEVSCDELNALVDIAIKTDGVFGARMTGAGFGGSAICLVEADKIDDLVERVKAEYPRRVGRSLTFYIAETGDGASVINLSDRTSSVPVLMVQ